VGLFLLREMKKRRRVMMQLASSTARLDAIAAFRGLRRLPRVIEIIITGSCARVCLWMGFFFFRRAHKSESHNLYSTDAVGVNIFIVWVGVVVFFFVRGSGMRRFGDPAAIVEAMADGGGGLGRRRLVEREKASLASRASAL